MRMISRRRGLNGIEEIYMQIALIDGFMVAEEVREEFLSNVHFSANYLKTLAGFVEGYVYERAADGKGFDVVTTAVWESEAAFEAARQTAAIEFQKLGFNP